MPSLAACRCLFRLMRHCCLGRWTCLLVSESFLILNSNFYCYALTFWPGQKCHSRWCTGRKWHILMAIMSGNRVGGNWLMKWDEVKKRYHYTLIDWRTGRVWPLNCMTFISARWRSHRPFQRWRKWHIPIARYRKKLRRRGGVSISPRGSLKVI